MEINLFHKDKYALVLGGGGAKGAFQVGAWKALIECKVKFEAIIGASAGALNGAFIAQNDFSGIWNLWQELTLDKVLDIPPELIKDGKFTFSKEGIKHLRQLQDDFLKYKGFNTKPLQELIKKYLDVQKIIHSGLDFGLVTYDIVNLKPIEVFLDEIHPQELEFYLLGSATLPGFQMTKYKNQVLLDGGLHDNVPYELAKKRGYHKIIILDVSGLGRNRIPRTEGTETIYIKNSEDLGSLIDFTPENVFHKIEMGYLDTLKVFGKISGIDYYYKRDSSIENRLLKIIESKAKCEQFNTFLKKSRKDDHIIKRIRKILPKHLQLHKDFICVLAECTAESLNLPRIKQYSFNELLQEIMIAKNQVIEKSKMRKESIKSFESFMQSIQDIPKLLNLPPYHYETLLDYFMGHQDENIHYTKALNKIFPVLLPAKLFFIILDDYFYKG
ncbi:MAG: patatin-like phospholipase family protein [Spirochaetes bacterium]|nr:patatin-like phospholipase family protein [Spirochaetota bacterium]